MKAKDLMAGDWVAFRGKPYQYTAQDIASMAECEAAGSSTDSSEIPLTEEILAKNFERSGTKFGIFDDYFDLFIYEMTDRIWAVVYHSCEFSLPDERVHICWVHELQHFLNHCGIYNEIKID